MMKYFIGLISVLLAALTALADVCEAGRWDHSESDYVILDSAEKFFVSLKQREYRTVWNLLSEQSHSTIIDDVYETSRDNGIVIKKEDIREDFQNGGLISLNYWNAFTGRFNPDIVLNERVWEFGPIERDEAVILLRERAVTELKMFKEDNHWKVGLVESFWSRRHLRVVKQIQSLLTR